MLIASLRFYLWSFSPPSGSNQLSLLGCPILHVPSLSPGPSPALASTDYKTSLHAVCVLPLVKRHALWGIPCCFGIVASLNINWMKLLALYSPEKLNTKFKFPANSYNGGEGESTYHSNNWDVRSLCLKQILFQRIRSSHDDTLIVVNLIIWKAVSYLAL
jgi:hypothetical protein